MPILLEISDLAIDFEYHGIITNALKGFNCKIHEGRTLGVVGESGSGKTITALSIMGLLPVPSATVSSGKIKYISERSGSTDLLKLNHKQFNQIRGKEISMIFQEPMTSLNPVMKCGKQVKESLIIHLGLQGRKARDEVIRWFREVRLPRPEEMYHAYPHQLSGGQKQRVMIAMAMCCQPRLLIADEPTTALDVTVQRSILDLMKELQAKYGTSILFITHDLGVISSMADEVIIMRNGSIVETGTTQEVFNHPVDPYTRGLIACRPSPGKKRDRLLTIRDFMENKVDLNIDAEQQPTKKATAGSPENPDREKENLVTMEDVSIWFQGKGKRRKTVVRALDHVDLEVYQGETLGLVGESGSGKTTLGKSILKLVPIESGSIQYRGQDIFGRDFNNRWFRKSVQIIFQDPYGTLNPRMSVGKAIEEPLQVHRILTSKRARRERVMLLLERVGLERSHYTRYPHEFSGGQRQRIGIARALAVEPEFIICDESVSALDVSIQAQILNLLNNLKDEFGFTFIFISHDLAVVRHMSDRIVVMKDGKIIETADAEDLFDNATSPYTRKLLNSIPGIS